MKNKILEFQTVLYFESQILALFDDSGLRLLTKYIASFGYINFWSNIYLILYPSLENSITHITSLGSVGLLGLSWILLRAFGSGKIFFGKSAAGELDLSELDFPDFLGGLSYL